MESVMQVVEVLKGNIPWISTILVFAFFVRFLKTRVFTEEKSHQKKLNWFWWWANQSLSIQPVVWGLVLGVFWRDPQGLGWGTIPSSIAFGACGAVSLLFWGAVDRLTERKGFKIRLAGESEAPPENFREG